MIILFWPKLLFTDYNFFDFLTNFFRSDDEDKKSIEREIFGAELIPESPTQLTFWEKFLELQIKMLVTNQENVQNHNYASDPTEWLFLTRGIAYFIAKDSNVSSFLISSHLTMPVLNFRVVHITAEAFYQSSNTEQLSSIAWLSS